MSLWVVVGGQYGSEGKGKISAFIAKREDLDICVRCGGPNSGHSFVDERGTPFLVRQLPTGFINPRTRLLIPAGGLIDPHVLKQEIESLSIAASRIGIDGNCFVIEQRDRDAETKLRLGERLSSTLCGVGAALSRRILRGEDAKLVRHSIAEYPWLSRYVTDVSGEINEQLDRGKKILIEGTQGFGLSLYHSEHYPHATSRDTTVAGFLGEVGVSPRLVTDVVLVLRTFPIRVAGRQAGPLNEEMTWDQVQRESGYSYSVEEHTSVTHKVRRVGRFDWKLAKKAVQINRPTRLAINGLDLLDCNNRGITGFGELTPEATDFVERLQNEFSVPVTYMGTGPGLNETIAAPSDVRDTSQDSEIVLLNSESRCGG